MWERVLSSRGKSKEKTPHNLTPKLVEDMATDVLENNKIVEMF
jgi:hypothetical protein